MWENWEVRGSISPENNKLSPELQKNVADIFEFIRELDIQTQDVFQNIDDIEQIIAEARWKDVNNIQYQEALNKIYIEIQVLVKKRNYIYTILKRIENIKVDYSTRTPSNSQKISISNIRLKILEAKSSYPDDSNFISILSKLQLKLDKIFSI